MAAGSMAGKGNCSKLGTTRRNPFMGSNTDCAHLFRYFYSGIPAPGAAPCEDQGVADSSGAPHNPSAPPGKATKYARREYERRFLLAEMPIDPPERIVRIIDRYIDGTRLRLRQMTQVRPRADVPVFKLTQKVPAPDGSPGLMTNTYLSEREYEVLSILPATVLRKTRHSIPLLGVDLFEGELTDLILAEAEFESRTELDAFVPPSFVVTEVTTDGRFTGGQLSRTTAAECRALLDSFGVALDRRRP